MRAYDIQIRFPAPKGAAPGTEGPAKILKAVFLPGVDPQFEAVQHVAPMWGTKGLTITAQPSQE